jgi:hypothetical protein
MSRPKKPTPNLGSPIGGYIAKEKSRAAKAPSLKQPSPNDPLVYRDTTNKLGDPAKNGIAPAKAPTFQLDDDARQVVGRPKTRRRPRTK